MLQYSTEMGKSAQVRKILSFHKDSESPDMDNACGGMANQLSQFSRVSDILYRSLPVNTATERGRMMNSWSMRTSSPSG